MAAAISLILVVTLGTVLAALIPETAEDALDRSERYEVSDVYEWQCPSRNGYAHRTVELHLQISTQEFEDSIRSHVFREGTRLVPAPYNMVDAQDPYVRQIAQHILDETEGYGDDVRILAALNFVQTAISYGYDDDLYGREEFWARPLETLYLHRGDCEDTSVLFCSVAMAMGFQCVLLDMPGHVAAGVWMGDGELMFCETALDSPRGTSVLIPSDAVAYAPSYGGALAVINECLAELRFLIRSVAGA